MMAALDSAVRIGTAVPLRLRDDSPGGGELCAGFVRIEAGDYPRLEPLRRSFLHATELAAFAVLPAEKRRRSYLLGRYAAKAALGVLAKGLDPRRIEIRPGAFDQPVVRAPLAEPLEVSISHSETQAGALAFPAGFPMALDFEELDAERAAIMKSQAEPQELAGALAVTGSEAAACTLVWTAKEALSKALRCGMTVPFELLALEGVERSAGFMTGRFRNFGQYKFQAWIGPAFVLSLVLPLRSELLTDLAPCLAEGAVS